jgi:phage replication O-like protein O
MASPQKENGFTAISNELFKAILESPFTLRELKIIFTVIRFTYGFNRKEAELAVRFISKATGIKFTHVAESINTLQSKNILILSKSESHRQGRIIKLNKDYETWDIKRSQISNISLKSNGSVPEKVTLTVPNRVTKKENNKENIKTWFDSLGIDINNKRWSEENLAKSKYHK